MGTILWATKMAAHPKQVQEFRNALQSIQPIMVDPKASRDEKRKTLCMMVNELSENVFKLKPIAEQIMTIINIKEEVCREYADSEVQVEGILGWLPRMAKYRGMLLEEVRAKRISYRLKV